MLEFEPDFERRSSFVDVGWAEFWHRTGSPRRVLSRPSGSRGDSYDNALAESIIGLYKTEVTRRRGPWRGPEDIEFAILEWVHWYNTQRLLEPIGNVAPVEYEMNYYRSQEGSLEMARLN